MKTLPFLLTAPILIIFLGFGLQPAHADDANGVSIQNIKVQPSSVKVGDTFTITATLVNNSTDSIGVSDVGSNDCQGPFFTIKFDDHVKVVEKEIACSYVALEERLDPDKKYTGTSPGLSFTYVATESGTANATVTFPYGVKNQTDPSQSVIEQAVSKSFQFFIHDANYDSSGPPIPTPGTILPLQQFRSGIIATDVTCRQEFQLAFKKEDSSPACVLPDDLANLVMRDWTVNPLSNILDAGYYTQEQQNKLFYDIMNLPQLRQWSETGWRFTGGNSIGDDTYNVHFSQLGLYLPPNSGNPKVTCDKGWYASVAIDTRKLVILNASYPSGSDCGNLGSATLTPPHQISCDQNCKSNQESSGMLCYQVDPDGNNYCIPKENNMTQILIPPAMTVFGRHVTPQEVTVQIGVNNTVQWTNADDSMYDIVGDKQQFRSGMIMTNSTWIHTFDESGVFGYHGEPAPWLRGQVTVLPANNQTNSTRD